MGLTVRQTDTILQPIVNTHARLRQERVVTAERENSAAMTKSYSDPRVMALQTAIETALGSSWEMGGYLNIRSRIYQYITAEWPLYESGVRSSPAAEALKDAGYTYAANIPQFYETSTYSLLIAALRTTKMSWGGIAEPLSNLYIETTIAMTPEDVIAACDKFLLELR